MLIDLHVMMDGWFDRLNVASIGLGAEALSKVLILQRHVGHVSSDGVPAPQNGSKILINQACSPTGGWSLTSSFLSSDSPSLKAAAFAPEETENDFSNA